MKEKDSENLEKESSDPKIICSACQKFTNILEKILQQTFSLYTNILRNQSKCFWFLIAFLLYLILCRSLATKLISKKIIGKMIVIYCYKRESEKKGNSNQNQLITKKTKIKAIFNSKYIPPKYICKKVYNSKKFKERGG